jgi:hypothetical protein
MNRGSGVFSPWRGKHSGLMDENDQLALDGPDNP